MTRVRFADAELTRHNNFNVKSRGDADRHRFPVRGGGRVYFWMRV